MRIYGYLRLERAPDEHHEHRQRAAQHSTDKGTRTGTRTSNAARSNTKKWSTAKVVIR